MGHEPLLFLPPGRPFTLLTDHKPLKKLDQTHAGTLNRMQEAL